jgi:1-acyl-sn-glycerol-3-phosphate acyltransferase
VRVLQVRRRAPGWPAWRVLFWWTGVRFLCWLFMKICYRLRCDGWENVPRTGPIIYVSNHQSHFDPILVGIPVGDRPFSGLGRHTLFQSKILAWIMRGIGAIELKRGESDTGAIKTALAELEAGRCVMLFPEGTRTRDGAIGEFKRGVLLLVKRAPEHALIVPVAIDGAFDVWPTSAKRPKLHGRIGVKVGPAWTPQELLAEGPDMALETMRRGIETLRLRLGLRTSEIATGAAGDSPAGFDNEVSQARSGPRDQR